MDSSDVTRLVILFILLMLSAFFSSAETSLMSINKLRMKSLSEEGIRGAATVCRLIENPSRMLSVILIGNNVVNLSASSLTTTFAMDLCTKMGLSRNSSLWISLSTGILTILILLFGEIVPKSVATANADKMAMIYARPIFVLTVLLKPVVIFMDGLSGIFLKMLHIDPTSAPSITENELRTIVDVSHEEGVIESEERRMITNVVDFGDAMAKDVMTPQMDVVFISADTDYNGVLEAYADGRYSRLPVFEETHDNIIGILNLKDVFLYRGDENLFSIKDVMREPYFTYEYKKTSELFFEMRQDSIALAIVLDEYGATAGIVTLEDLIEEIVGDIRDEYDEAEEDPITQCSENEYIALGVAKLEEINEMTGLHLESDDYDSIAGHIINLLEHLPSEKETVFDDEAEYTILELDKNRIDKVHIQVFKKDEEEADEEEAS